MGVVPQLDNLDIDVTVEDNLAVFARLYRVADVPAAVDRALDLARLQDRRKDAVDELSGGMRRRLLLARGLVHEPRLVLLDEPTVGLDPQIRTQIWTLIDGLRSRGATILMSTHYIEEAERLADEVAVMAQGKVIARGKPSELIAKHAGRETAEVYGPPDRLAEVRAQAESEGLKVRPAGPADRDRRLRARDRTARSPTTPSAAPPRSRTSSSCSPARRPNERSRDHQDAPDAAPRARRDRRRDEPRGRQLPHLLEGDDLLEPARADRSTCSPSGSASARRSSTRSTASTTSSSSAPGWSRPR